MFIPTQQRTQPTGRPCRHKSARGFTLLELLIVLVIIGGLASIVIPIYSNYVDKATITVAISTLNTVRKNLEAFHVDNDKYPIPPINFNSGLDADLDRVFSAMLLDQINDDVTGINYNTDIDGYIVTAKARDKKQTSLILTPSDIAKAP